ncbi:MAG: hypothetical protein KF773_32540 [Deltaproteobacteria bacterium]|nr:hypothetical protein [Deltaproteobacteria bacterium]
MAIRPLAVLVVVALAGCRGRRDAADPSALPVPREGMSVAIYARAGGGWASVDDRRRIEVHGDTILLDRIDPSAPLPSLVIEPLADPRDLSIRACVRERLESEPEPVEHPAPPRAAATGMSPIVRCTVRGRPGTYLVRVLHVAPISATATAASGILRYRAQTEVTVAGGDRALVSTRYAITTPPWRTRADVVLYDGLPGKVTPPVELARGAIDLDGGVAILALPSRELPAKLRRVYDGAVRTDAVEPRDAQWRRDSHQAVWVHLEVEGRIPPGPVHVHHEAEPEGGGPLVVRDVDVGALVRRRLGDVTRLPLYIDDTLRGFRRHWVDRADGASLTDRFQLAVSNLGTEMREVWIEEELRPARHREVVRARPTKPAVSREVTRTVVELAPQGTERVGYTIHYEF